MHVKGCCLCVSVSQGHVLSPNIQRGAAEGGAQRGAAGGGAEPGTAGGGAQRGTARGGALREDLGP